MFPYAKKALRVIYGKDWRDHSPRYLKEIAYLPVEISIHSKLLASYINL